MSTVINTLYKYDGLPKNQTKKKKKPHSQHPLLSQNAVVQLKKVAFLFSTAINILPFSVQILLLLLVLILLISEDIGAYKQENTSRVPLCRRSEYLRTARYVFLLPLHFCSFINLISTVVM